MFRCPYEIPWKKLCAPPKRPKSPRRTERQRETDERRPIHTVEWAWRWPTFGPFILRHWGEAHYFRGIWYSGKIKDVAAMIAELPDEPEHLEAYRELIARWEAQDPGDVEMQGENAALHIEAMKRLLAQTEATP